MASHSINSSDKVLCAISGGMDSMVMLDLFRQSNIPIEVMHMNYQLRGEASDADQQLVEQICAKYHITCHIKSVVKPKEVNTQEWARNERYQFLKELDKQNTYRYIATAHHNQDQLETILLSIFKGYSLQTIKTLRDKFIRPLLGVNKEDIEVYASANIVEYRHDQSNFSNDYDRNFLRNEIIPSLRNRFQNFDKRVLKFAERQTLKNNIADHLINEKVDYFSSSGANNLGDFLYQKIDLKILGEKEGKNILFSYMKMTFQLNENQLNNLLESTDPRAMILNKTHQCQRDEKYLYICEKNSSKSEQKIKANEIPFQLKKLNLRSSNQIPSARSANQLLVDYEQLTFPLTLRKVKESDKFRSFGLKGKSTSLTKFLKDKGFPAISRLHEYLLIDDNGRIIVPGIEIDYVLKITNSSKTALIIDLQDKTR